MKKLLAAVLISIIAIALAAAPTHAQGNRDITGYFTCPVFKEYVAASFSGSDTQIFYEDVASITSLPLEGLGITSLDGIQHFTSLTQLFIMDCGITTLDVSGLYVLEVIFIVGAPLTTVTMSNNPALISVLIDGTLLTELDVSALSALEELWLSTNNLASLDVSNNPALVILAAYRNQLESLDISNNPELRVLRVGGNLLTELDVSHSTELRSLEVWGNQLTELDISNNHMLIRLDVSHNYLATLNVFNNTLLDFLDVSNNLMQFPCDVAGWREIGLEMTGDFVFEFPWQRDAGQSAPLTQPPSRQIVYVGELIPDIGLTGYGAVDRAPISREILRSSYRNRNDHQISLDFAEIYLGPAASRHLYNASQGSHIYVELFELERDDPSQLPIYLVKFLDQTGDSINYFGGAVGVIIHTIMPSHWNPDGVHAKTMYIDDEDNTAWEMIRASLYRYGEFAVILRESTFFTAGHYFVTFPDLTEGCEYTFDIEAAASRGLVHGFPDGNFRPYSYVTRAGFVYMLYAVVDTFAAATQHGFNDVPYGRWYNGAIAAFYNAGVFDDAFQGAEFNPGSRITHEEAWQILTNLGIDVDDFGLSFWYTSYEYLTRAEAVFYQLVLLFNRYW